MAESKRIYLMRHAKPELPFGGRVYYGRTDFPLSAEGRAAAARLGEHLRGRITFDALYTSGMKRAVETASLAVPGMTGTSVPELREVDLGDWDGRRTTRCASSSARYTNAAALSSRARPRPEAKALKRCSAAQYRPLRKSYRRTSAATS